MESILTLENIFSQKIYEPNTWTGYNKNLDEEVRKNIEQFLTRPLQDEDFNFNPNHRYLLIQKEQKSIYRHSTKAIVYLFDIENNTFFLINERPISHASFSPNNTYIAYVLENNLFLLNIKSKEIIFQTNDGVKNEIINGISDWVYEEELGFTKAYEWSNTGNQIAYFRFDESLVKEYSLTFYNDKYNKPYTYKYPKAGKANADIRIYSYNIQTGISQLVPIASDGGYIPKIAWNSTEQLMVFHLNRHQNELNIWKYNVQDKSVELFYQEVNERYIDFTHDWYFLENGNMLFTSEKDGFRSIFMQTESNTARLTNNQYEIDQIIGIDQTNQWIYYTAAFPSPMERQIFACDYNGRSTQLTQNEGWNELTLKEDFEEAVIQYSTMNKPPIWKKYSIIKAPNALPSFTFLEEIVTNRPLDQKLQQLNLSQVEWLNRPNENGISINGWMLKPKNFNSTQKYPLLFCNYGGPGHQTVINKYGAVTLWHQLMADRGFILVSFDNTGTGGRGEDFKKKTYLQLGKLEIEDQIYLAKQLAQLSYIDPQRIGHWGWSFGGFMSTLAISKGADIFSYAVAIAPVTNWKYYDTIYTERFMKTPEENPSGYYDNSPFSYTSSIKGKLLIMHGEADDNVHVQHTYQWVKELIKNDISFDMVIYPDKNHRINGLHTHYHLWKKITSWLTENFIKK